MPIMVALTIGGSKPTLMANVIIKQMVSVTAIFLETKPKTASIIAPSMAMFEPERTMMCSRPDL